MRPKTYPILIWFLSEDLEESARFLSDRYLAKTIDGCVHALVCSRLYFIGIRSKKFYNYYFSKERKEETMNRFFPCWQSSRSPNFQCYQSRVSKWTRMCQEHYDLVLRYLEILLDEYSFRKSKVHSARFFLDWETSQAPKIKMPRSNSKKIVFEWKSLNPKYRDKDICLGYRKLYKAILGNDGIKIDDYSRRDIPDFLLDQESKDKNLGLWMI